MHRLVAARSGRIRRQAGGIVLTLVAACLTFVLPTTPAHAVATRYLDEVFPNVTTTSDVVYDTPINYDDTPIQVKLDIHRPAGDTETNRPAIVYIHGGYFAGGDKSEGTTAMESAARRGYVGVSINYRVWPGAALDGVKLAWGIAAAQHDAQSAVRWLRRNAADLGINPVAIFAAGYSAGAITALHVNYRGFDPGDGGNQGYASDVAGAVSMAGFSLATPPHSPPVIMFHGTADPIVHYDWATSTCNAAVAAGDQCTLYSYDGAGHDLSPYLQSDILPKIWAFFYSLLPGVLTLPAPLAGFHPVSPTRQLDTRDGTGIGAVGPVGAGETISLSFTGVGGVPSSGVSAVVLNVTAVAPTATTHVTVWPGGQAKPATSNLNVVGQTVANLVTTGVGPGGMVQLFNNTGSVHLVADVVGWYDDGTVAGDRFNAISPTRLLDTRDGAPLGASTLDVAVGGTAAVPGDATAAVLNLTAVGATAKSHLTAWPAGETMPGVSNLNFVAGQTRANLATVKLGNAGKVSIANNAGTVYPLADATGFFEPTGTRFVSIAPSRVLDTRNGIGAPAAPVVGGTSIDVFIKTAPGLPPDGVAGVVINVTAVGASEASHVTVWPTGTAQPNASNLNVADDAATPNLVMVGVGGGGTISLFNNSGTVHLVGDVVGYFT